MAVRRFVRTAYAWLSGGAEDVTDSEILLPTGKLPPPVCFIFDGSASGHELLVTLLKQHNINAQIFSDLKYMNRAYGKARPQLVILGSSLERQQLESVIRLLSEKDYSGSIQPIVTAANRNAVNAALKKVRGVRVLPTIAEPVKASAIDMVVKSEGLARTSEGRPKIDLDVALKNGWIEYWYQPRIDLDTRLLSGVECLARLRHPVHGILKRDCFLEGASDSARFILASNAVRTLIADWKLFREFGHNVFINTHMPALIWRNARIFDVLKRIRPGHGDWPGIGFDMDVIPDVDAIALEKIAHLLVDVHKVRIAINEFDNGVASQMMVRTFRPAALKLPREIAHGCSDDPARQKTCRELIAFAHDRQMRAVAVGVTYKDDLEFLVGAGCDAAQGQVFSRALPRDQCMMLLQRHARVSSGPRPSKASGSARSGTRSPRRA